MITEKICLNVLAVGEEDGQNTYEIRRMWGEQGKKALVIELYPTISADKCGMMDVSTMHLMNHAQDFGWEDVRIVNLYSTVVAQKPSVKELTSNSLAYIEEILEENDIKTYDIVIAWGNSLSTHQGTINNKLDLLSMLQDKGLSKNVKCISVKGMESQSFGVHPLFLGLHFPKAKWELIGYPLKKCLEELEKGVKRVQKVEKKTKKKNEEVSEKIEKEVEAK